MKPLPQHLLNNLPLWKGKQWYHQRFDGSPYLLHLIAEAEIREEPRKKSMHNLVHYCFFDHGKADWYIEMGDIKRIYTKMIRLGATNKNLSKDLIQDWSKDQKKFYAFCVKIMKTDLQRLSNDELIALHDDFVEKALNKNTSSSIIDGFALGTDELLAENIKQAYEKSALKESMKFTEVFSVLTAPVHLSFINEAEISLLTAALAIRANPSKKNEIIKKHQQKYFWIHNNYVTAQILSVDYFAQEIDKVLSLGIDLKGEIAKIKNTPVESKKKKDALLEKIALSAETKLLITVSEDFTYWQDERKKSTFWNAHCATLLLDEIGRRVDIPSLELKYLLPQEVSAIFVNTPSRKELQARVNNSAFYWDTDGFDVVTGMGADTVKKEILGSTDLSNVDDFRGLTACMGKVIGTAKVLKSVTEMDKVQKGDVLVAVMTRPDYVPAMKKAAAIVTDEGGVTCHAAIVSRELSIPCIIGTKIATKVLQDGMKVEVNANHGWVRILR